MLKSTVVKNDPRGPATIQLSGRFEGKSEEVEAIRYAFRRGGIIDQSTRVVVKTMPTFHANGEKPFLARTLGTIIRQNRKEVLLDSPVVWDDSARFFPRNKK
jgi:hypothetical protein